MYLDYANSLSCAGCEMSELAADLNNADVVLFVVVQYAESLALRQGRKIAQRLPKRDDNMIGTDGGTNAFGG